MCKILIISPNERVGLRLKELLTRSGNRVRTHFEMQDGESSEKDSFDLVVSLYPTHDQHSDNTRRYRTLVISQSDSGPQNIDVERDGVYDLESLGRLGSKVGRITSALTASPRRQPLGISTASNSENPGELALAKMIGRSSAIKAVKTRIRRISRFPGIPVLVTGETGTGKELVVNALHACSRRKDKPLVKVNCAAIPDTLLESQLFGHRKGAFSGAVADQKGLVEEADRGTLFLDEISSLKLELQPKLLRFLEDGSYMRVGETKERKSNAWVLAATNEDLSAGSNALKLREDLMFRLSGNQIVLPALRQRAGDISLLANYFLHAFAKEFEQEEAVLSFANRERMLEHSWPGNIRELRQVMMTYQFEGDEAVRKRLREPSVADTEILTNHPTPRIEPLRVLEKKYILQVLQLNHFNIRKTARLLQVDRNTLRRKIAHYNLGAKGAKSTPA